MFCIIVEFGDHGVHFHLAVNLVFLSDDVNWWRISKAVDVNLPILLKFDAMMGVICPCCSYDE